MGLVPRQGPQNTLAALAVRVPGSSALPAPGLGSLPSEASQLRAPRAGTLLPLARLAGPAGRLAVWPAPWGCQRGCSGEVAGSMAEAGQALAMEPHSQDRCGGWTGHGLPGGGHWGVLVASLG